MIVSKVLGVDVYKQTVVVLCNNNMALIDEKFFFNSSSCNHRPLLLPLIDALCPGTAMK